MTLSTVSISSIHKTCDKRKLENFRLNSDKNTFTSLFTIQSSSLQRSDVIKIKKISTNLNDWNKQIAETGIEDFLGKINKDK